ncbi:hypothetical protein [Staphylothermus hellenicus]|uniref:Uncharacterized protein n=1 Tax=Staphylothermus hellenicus (strain DSM 12710 / JCM 10830 / BK20S6-10-b1 / P8) TaxID=591019 RepID=D7D8M4_STAHD|nr:hypothetical protein [Staphylothermus hellenicus]ADI32120.1 hypothetical protein Shell_1015 [Staphylothermus hellenicus DSM 12710]
MGKMEVIDIDSGKPKLSIGRRKYALEEVDETHYQAIVSYRTLSKYIFQDLPAPETLRGNILIEFLPFTKKSGEYAYESKGLRFFGEASVWRDNERGHVYLEHTVYTSKYSFNAWIPIDLYTFIIVKIAKELGFEAEVYRDEANVVVEIEKTYPLDTPVRIALLEIKEIDRKARRTLDKILSKIKKKDIKILAKELNTSTEEILNILKMPEEKLSTLP